MQMNFSNCQEKNRKNEKKFLQNSVPKNEKSYDCKNVQKDHN